MTNEAFSYMRRYGKTLYVLIEVLYFTFSLFSRFINAVFFGGSMHQTLSARAYIESQNCKVWQRRQNFINKLFYLETLFTGEEHCKASWQAEVYRAKRTLLRNKELGVNAMVE